MGDPRTLLVIVMMGIFALYAVLSASAAITILVK